MATCIRGGVLYKRHQFARKGKKGVCKACGFLRKTERNTRATEKKVPPVSSGPTQAQRPLGREEAPMG